MKVLHHLLNSLLPYDCPCCENNVMEPFATLCQECTNYFEKHLYLQNINLAHSLNKPLIDKREFYFHHLFYIGYYNFREKSVFQKAKFHNDVVMQNFLISFLKQNGQGYFQNINYLIPAPSSKDLIYFITQKLAKHYKIPVINIFKKNKKQQSKTLDQFSRYREIQNNIMLKNNKKISMNCNEKFLIIDDLWTTGATMNHLCKLLVNYGISHSQINCLVLFIRPKIQE
ncbi:MAG: phosphoribosyltransferase family protein [Spirochaetia bacterium]|nr:phosphoribosyltransferase family protein [Spirochaetia bacterium]